MPRYLSLVQIDEETMPAEGPSPQLLRRIGELMEEMTRAGRSMRTTGRSPANCARSRSGRPLGRRHSRGARPAALIGPARPLPHDGSFWTGVVGVS